MAVHRNGSLEYFKIIFFEQILIKTYKVKNQKLSLIPVLTHVHAHIQPYLGKCTATFDHSTASASSTCNSCFARFWYPFLNKDEYMYVFSLTIKTKICY